MIRLSTTTQKLQALLGGVPTTQADILVTYTDVTATTWTGGTQPSVSNSTTAVDICPAPAASTIRNIDLINIRNNDVANIVLTIRVNDNTSLYKLITVTLQVGDSLRFTHANGWGVTDSNGVLKQSPSGVTFSTGGSLSVIGVASISGNNTGDNSANNLYSGLVTMSYPGAGIALSTGTAWDTSITNSSANWNTAYGWGNHTGLYTFIANKWQWDGGATNLVAATGRTSLGLGTAATTDATAYDVAGAAAAVTPTTLGLVIGTNVQAYNSNLTAINQALTTTSSPSFTTVTAALTGTASGTAGQISTHAALQTGVHGISITAGQTLTVTTGGTIASGAYAAAYSLPTATASVLGGVKPDGTTITNTTGAISVTHPLTSAPGTAAYTASTAYDVAGAAAAVTPTTLGLVIGTNVQAYNSNLTAINQALTTTSSPSFTTVTAALTGTASGTAGQISTHASLQTGVHGVSITAGKTFSSTGTLTLSGTDGSTLNIGTGGTLGTAAYTATTAYDVAGAAAAVTPTTLNLVIGTNVQAYDADLTTWAGITPGANVGTALAVAVGTDGAFVVKGGALGTPSSGTLTNVSGLPAAGVTGTALVSAAIGTTVQTQGAKLDGIQALVSATGWLHNDGAGMFSYSTPTAANVGAPSGSGTSTGANTGDQTITLTGGVTGSGTGSFVATVATNANLTGPITSVGNATSVTTGAITNLMLAGDIFAFAAAMG